MAEFSKTLEWPLVHSINGFRLVCHSLIETVSIVFGRTENLKSHKTGHHGLRVNIGEESKSWRKGRQQRGEG